MNQDVASYLNGFSPEVREKLNAIRTLVAALAPEAELGMNYGIPTFKLQGKNLVHFAAFKKHLGFYPTPSGITQFAQELTDYECSKGTIKFPINDPLPMDLIKKITRFRITEVTGS